MVTAGDELISDILPWTPTHGYTGVDRLAKTFIRSVQTQGADKRFDQVQWLIWKDGERKRKSKESGLSACDDDDDDERLDKKEFEKKKITKEVSRKKG